LSWQLSPQETLVNCAHDQQFGVPLPATRNSACLMKQLLVTAVCEKGLATVLHEKPEDASGEDCHARRFVAGSELP
jgi:hypothetical protein